MPRQERPPEGDHPALVRSARDQPRDAPYVGLGAFQVADSDRFFGRDRVLADLLARVRKHRLVAVFGVSGSGKSSLLRAGLVARARTTGFDAGGPRPAVLFTPGAHPVEECAAWMAAWSGQPAAALRADFAEHPENLHLHVHRSLVERSDPGDLLLVIDQFEELFTLCRDPDERDAFLALLVSAIYPPAARIRVVLGIRADFLPRCARYPALVRAVNDAAVPVGPMTAADLRLAVTEPAARRGCSVETALLTRIVADAADQPAPLPLVSHALPMTWQRRRGSTLTLAGYQAVGGIRHAIARSAEDLYSTVDSDRQPLVRQVFLRLVVAGQGTGDTCRRIPTDELDQLDRVSREVIDTLVRARLLTGGDAGVEIAHEALISAWPRLRSWLANDRDGPRGRRRLTDAAHIDEQRAHRRRTRRRWVLAAAVAGLLCLTAVTGVAALSRHPDTQAQQAVAISRELAARSMALRRTQRGDSQLLAILALRQAPTAEARSAVLTDQTPRFVARFASTDLTSPAAIAISANGRTVAISHADGTTATCPDLAVWALADAGNGTVVWFPDRTGSEPPASASSISSVECGAALWVHDDDPVTAAALSPDGNILAIGHADGTTSIWDLTARRTIATRADQPSAVDAVAFVPGGHLVTVGNGTGAPFLCESPATPDAMPHATPDATVDPGCLDNIWIDNTDPAIPTSAIRAIAVSADGRSLALGNVDGRTSIWDLAAQRISATLVGQPPGATAVAFSPDGRTLATANTNDTISLWDIPSRRETATIDLTVAHGRTAIEEVAFSPDGHSLLAVSSGGGAALWNVDVDHVAAGLCMTAAVPDPDEWAGLVPELPYFPPCPPG